jgi:hypothetical protein
LLRGFASLANGTITKVKVEINVQALFGAETEVHNVAERMFRRSSAMMRQHFEFVHASLKDMRIERLARFSWRRCISTHFDTHIVGLAAFMWSRGFISKSQPEIDLVIL